MTQYFEGGKKREGEHFAVTIQQRSTNPQGGKNRTPPSPTLPIFSDVSTKSAQIGGNRPISPISLTVPSSQWEPYSTLCASWASGAAGFSSAEPQTDPS
jgi:hypothetical protein